MFSETCMGFIDFHELFSVLSLQDHILYSCMNTEQCNKNQMLTLNELNQGSLCTNVDQNLIPDQCNFRIKYLQSNAEN